MPAGRAAPWRSKPSEELQVLSAHLSQPSSAGNSNSSWYVLQRLGPSSFVVGQDPGGDKFKVALGNQPTCNCRPSATCLQEPCVHLLFIMLRVMRLPADNPLLWQSALTDRELQELLDGRLSSSSGNAARVAGRRTSSSSSGKPGGSVQRRTVEQDEPCPICYESLSNVDAAWLVWCSNSCGKSIHGRCMRVWSDHQTKTLQQELSCPLCRCPWGRLDWTPPAVTAGAASSNGKAAACARNCHKGVSCSSCNQSPIEGSRYRCLECAATSLCRACFTAGQHLQHSFVCCATPSALEQLAERPMQLGLQCNGVTQGAAVDLLTLHHNRSRGRGACGGEQVAHHNRRGTPPAGSSSGSSAPGRCNTAGSNAAAAAAEHPLQLGLQCNSLVQAKRTAPQASGGSSSRTSSRTAGQHDGSDVNGRHDHSSSTESLGRRRGSAPAESLLPPAAAGPAAPGAAAAARAAAAAAAAQQANQGDAAVNSLGLLSAGLQPSSSRSSRSSSSTCSSVSSNGGCKRNSSKAGSTASAAAGSEAPARTCGHLQLSRTPSVALQNDFAALVLSGHAAPGRSTAATVRSVATSGQELLDIGAPGASGAAAIARAAVAANQRGSLVRYADSTAKGRGANSVGKRELSNARTKACAAARPAQQQQSLTVCGLGAHLAPTNLTSIPAIRLD